LARTCHAGIPNSVCLGPDGPVGVQDRMPVDGAADHNQFIQGSVGIRCGATDARGGEGQGRFSTGGQGPGSSPPERAVINVPIDVEKSYWQPSGNQQIPASPAGIEALGPAIVLRPKFGLPMGASCTIVFAEEVVDKDGIRPCAPPNGDIDADCTPGDTSAVTFGVEPMDLVTVPKDGDANVPRIGEITLDFNAIMNGPRLLEEVVVAKGGVRVTGFVLVENLEPDRPSYKLKLPGGFEASTAYTVTVPATVVDRFEQPLGYDVTFQFTTAAN